MDPFLQDPVAAARYAANLQSLSAGGLPLNVIERLKAQATRQGTSRELFTSSLSAGEFALVRGAGWVALGQVMGCAVCYVGREWKSCLWRDSDVLNGAGYELTATTTRIRDARRLALGRLQQEAALLGGAGVVAVRLEHRDTEDEDGNPALQVIALGTAIRERGAPGWRKPFLTNVTGQEFWLLAQAGFRPAGLVSGNCTYCRVPSRKLQRALRRGSRSSFANQELTEYTEALYNARSLTAERMEDEARELGASGVIGVSIDFDFHVDRFDQMDQPGASLVYHFTALGTAVVEAGPTRLVQSPACSVSLGGDRGAAVEGSDE